MSVSISDRDLHQLGELHPAEFFRDIIEPLGDSFDPEQAREYERIMHLWIPQIPYEAPVLPDRVATVYVFSRVTLGADIKITSIVLDAMKRRFPEADIVFVANQKSADLFATDKRIRHLPADYPRKRPVSARIAFAVELSGRIGTPHSIIVDPDSRMTQLGTLQMGDSHFHFPSRTVTDADNLTDLTNNWLERTFGVRGEAYIAPERVPIDDPGPRAAVSLGVGENDSKRIPGDFEHNLLRDLSATYATVWVDRGVGGEEAGRVTEAAAGLANVRFWEGSFAGFASIVSQCDYYAGYDSAGQHAAAAAGVSLTSYFAGAPSERFRKRWAPAGRGKIEIVNR